jgi:hypothetical protein
MNQCSSQAYCQTSCGHGAWLLSKRDSTSTGTAIRAVCCSLLLEGLRLSNSQEMNQARWTPIFLRGSDSRSLTSYIHESCIIVCVCSNLSQTYLKSVSAQSFYSSRSSNYMKTQSLKGGPEVVGTLLQ